MISDEKAVSGFPKRIYSLAIMLAGEAFVAPGPLAQEGTFGGMGAEMACVTGDEEARDRLNDER